MPQLTEEQIDGEASQLDSIETSARTQLPTSYQDYRLTGKEAEFNRVLNLYCHFDNLEGTTRSEKLLGCRTFAWFAWHIDTGEVRVMSNACHLRWCPSCSDSRFASIRHVVREWTLGLRSPKMFTLTLRHDASSLTDQIKRLYDRFRKFRQHKGIKARIRGGIWFFQLKRSAKSKQWHPHLHCILDADYVSKFTLSQEWFLTTGDSFIVDIRRIQNAGKVSDYVSRYCARPGLLSQFEEQDGIEVFTVLHGKRLCGAFGTARTVPLRPQKCPDAYKWLKLIDWSNCIANMQFGGAYRAVVRAYFAGTPCPESIVLELCPWSAVRLGVLKRAALVIENKPLQFKEFT